MGPSWSVDAWIDNVGSRLGYLGIYFNYVLVHESEFFNLFRLWCLPSGVI
jgi:hypothetical protein